MPPARHRSGAYFYEVTHALPDWPRERYLEPAPNYCSRPAETSSLPTSIRRSVPSPSRRRRSTSRASWMPPKRWPSGRLDGQLSGLALDQKNRFRCFGDRWRARSIARRLASGVQITSRKRALRCAVDAPLTLVALASAWLLAALRVWRGVDRDQEAGPIRIAQLMLGGIVGDGLVLACVTARAGVVTSRGPASRWIRRGIEKRLSSVARRIIALSSRTAEHE